MLSPEFCDLNSPTTAFTIDFIIGWKIVLDYLTGTVDLNVIRFNLRLSLVCRHTIVNDDIHSFSFLLLVRDLCG